MSIDHTFPELIEWTAGDTLPLRLSLLTDGGGEPVTSLADEGYAIRYTLKRTPKLPDSEKLPGSKSSAEGTIRLFGQHALWELSDAETAALPVGVEIFFDVQVTRIGKPFTLRKGRLLLSPQISQTSP